MKPATGTPLYKSGATARPFFTTVFAAPQKVARLTPTVPDIIISDNVSLAVARQRCGAHSGNQRPSGFVARPLCLAGHRVALEFVAPQKLSRLGP